MAKQFCEMECTYHFAFLTQNMRCKTVDGKPDKMSIGKDDDTSKLSDRDRNLRALINRLGKEQITYKNKGQVAGTSLSRCSFEIESIVCSGDVSEADYSKFNCAVANSDSESSKSPSSSTATKKPTRTAR